MKQKTTRKCLHCSEQFIPDPRNRERQCHCGKPECQVASKAASQRQWTCKPEKVALGSMIRKRTMMTNGWISKNLHLGDPSRVCRYCATAAGRPDIRKLVRKLEMSIGKA